MRVFTVVAMKTLKQQFNSAASGAIVQLRGRAIRRSRRLAERETRRRGSRWSASTAGCSPAHRGRGSWTRTPNSCGAACTLIARGLAAEETVPGIRGESDGFAVSLPGALYRALGAEDIRHRRDASPAVLMRRLFSLDYLMEHATRLGFPPKPRCEGRPRRGSPRRVSTSKKPMRRVEPERPRLRRTGLSAAPKAGEAAYPVSYTGAGEGLRPFEPQETRAPVEFARRGVAPLPSVAALPDG